MKPTRGSRLLCAAILGTLFLASHAVTVLPAYGFQASGQLASTVVGQPNFVSSTYAEAPNHLFRPFRVAFDNSGNLWVADENNDRVLEFRLPITDGESASIVIGQPDLTSRGYPLAPTQSSMQPVGIAFDSSGDLWVADTNNNRVLEFEPPFSNGMNASLELGQPPGSLEFTSNANLPTPGGLYYPVDLKFDSSGDLWVSDRGHNRVLEFRPPFADGMNASVVVGQDNLTSVAPLAPPSKNDLAGPNGIAFDSKGDLWVADEDNNRLLEFAASSLETSNPPAILELGQAAGAAEFSSYATAVNQSGFTSPLSIAFDPAGDLWMSDRANNRVLEFKPPFTDGMDASAVIGHAAGATSRQNPYNTNSSGLTQSTFWNPLGISFDGWGDLWVADQLNNRVLEFSGTAVATAGANVDVPTTTDVTVLDVSASTGDSCYRMGEQAVCHLVVSGGLTTGVRVDLIGVASSETVNVYSSYEGSQEPAYAAASQGIGVAAPAAFYGLAVSGIGNGTATVCVNDENQQSVPGAAGISYFSNGVWATPSTLSRSGSTICGTIPLAALYPSGGTSVIAVGSQTGAGPPTLASDPVVYVAVLLAAVLTSAILAVRRRTGKNGTPDEDEEQEGGDLSW